MTVGTSQAVFLNCTIADNLAALNGGGLFSEPFTRTSLANTIVWGNSGNQIVGPAAVTFSNVQGGQVGAGNINADPKFVDAPGGDYHLLATSPCIGRGSVVVGLLATDFEGDPRAAFGQVDIGADEFFQHLYHAGNATPGASIEVRFIGRSGEPAFWILAANLASSGISIPGLNGLLLLEPQSLVGIALGAVPVEGLVRLPLSIPAGFPAVSIPTQALIGQQLTNLDLLRIR